jgi:putative hemolysin
MTPKGKVFSLDGTLTVAEALPLVADQPFSRIPLYKDRIDDFYKVLYLRDLLEAAAGGRTDVRLEGIAHELLFISQYQAINDLFAMLRHRNRHFSMVVDEYGEVRGIVTLADLLEELVGEIYDESDIAPTTVKKVSGNEIVIDGAAELRVIEELFGMDLPGKATDSVGLWILNHTEYIPQADETFSIDGLQVKILKASSRSIDQVNVRQHQQEAGG